MVLAALHNNRHHMIKPLAVLIDKWLHLERPEPCGLPHIFPRQAVGRLGIARDAVIPVFAGSSVQ